MKHTPGPWKVFNSHKVIEVQEGDLLPVINWSGFDDSRRTHNEHLANAFLIASAPELLEALERIISVYGELVPREVNTIARAAISKAEGK
jgi:hypothetical protein